MDDFLVYSFVIVLLLLLPMLGLMLSPVGSVGASISAIPLSFMIMGSFFRLRRDVKDKGNWIFAAIFAGLPIAVLTYVIVNRVVIEGQSAIAITLGALVGAVLILYVSRGELIAKKHRNERTANEIGVLLSSYEDIAILGKPGSGKSTYVQFIALTFAQAKAGNKRYRKRGIARKRFGIRQWYLPILIPLRKVASYIEESNSEHPDKSICLEAFRQEVLPFEVRDDFSEAFVRHMFRKKKCILLLDGLDEVANTEQFRLIVNEIKGLVSQFPGNKFIVTSRHAGWRGGVGSAFVETEIRNLNDDQITIFVESWYQAIEKNRARLLGKHKTPTDKRFRERIAKDRANRLKQAIATVESIRNLAKNPLLLSMVCFVHYNKTLPKERLSLYEDCNRLLLEQWDVEKGLPQDDIPLSLARKELVMEEIAFALHSGTIGTDAERKETTSKQIIPMIERVLERFNLDAGLAEPLFQKLVNRTGLIVVVERYQDLYSFSHLTFQEFYTARYLHKNNIDIFPVAGGPACTDLSNLTGWWSEVLLLYGNMQKDVSPIIQRLCSAKSPDLLRSDLRIAAQCFSEALAPPKAEVESQLFAQLLAIRSRRNFAQATHALHPQVKQHLIRVARSREFFTYALLAAVHQARHTQELEELMSSLSRLLESADGDVQIAASQALAKLCQTQDVSRFANQEIIQRWLGNATPDLIFATMQIIPKFTQSPTEDFVIQVVKQAVDTPLKEIAECRQGLPLLHEDGPVLCQTLQEMTSSFFEASHPVLQERLTDTLFQILREPPELCRTYRIYGGRFINPFECTITLKECVECLMAVLLRLNNGEQKELHKLQLLDMLSKGTPQQQAWSVSLLGSCFGADRDVAELVLAKLEAPSAKVRLVALAALKDLSLNEPDIDLIQSKLTRALVEKSRLDKFWAQLLEIAVGKGALGITRQEAIQAASTLCALSDSWDGLHITDFLLSQDTLEGFREESYQWQQAFDGLKSKLTDGDIERIVDQLGKMPPITEVLDVLKTIIDLYGQENPVIGDKIGSILFQTIDGGNGSIRFLSELAPRVAEGSKEQDLLLQGLSSESQYWEAEHAFDILLENGLLFNT